MQTEIAFPHLLQAYFTERLMPQRQASPHTIASDRHTFCLLLQFAQQQCRRGGTVRAVAMHAWPRCIPSSTTRRCMPRSRAP